MTNSLAYAIAMFWNDDHGRTGHGNVSWITRGLRLARVFTDHHRIVVIRIGDGFHRFDLFGIAG
jgi:hypothetical protein